MNIEVKVLNSTRFIKLLIAASRWLSKYSDVLNDLNVYPIPDGDTGTNMSITLQAVENELIKLNYEPDMEELTDLVSEAFIFGAVGTSGTILAQIFQGFFESIKLKENIYIDDIKDAFELATKKAYGAIENSIDGSMLSVIKHVSEEAKKYDGPNDNFIPFLTYLKESAKEAVNNTPNQLQNLKDAGVVDAGGQGLFYIIEGFEKSVTDLEMVLDLERIIQSHSKRKNILENKNILTVRDIKFKYSTEFIIENGDFDLDEYKSKLINLGDSLVCVQILHKTKTYIHTNNPGLILSIANSYGDLSNIKIENLEIHQNNSFKSKSSSNKNKIMIQNENSNPIAFFAIVDNFELGNLLLNNGATAILVSNEIQSINVETIDDIISKIKSDQIIILSNNKDIISTLKITAKKSSKGITVLETASILEYFYILNNKTLSTTEILNDLKHNISVEIKKSTKNLEINDLHIEKDDFIAIINGNIKLKSNNLKELISDIYKIYISKDSLRIFSCIGVGSTEDGNAMLKSISSTIKYSDIVAPLTDCIYSIYLINRNPELPEIAIVTDSASDLTPDFMNGLKIDIIPLKIKFNNDTYYHDGENISREYFWKQLIENNALPKTSQPSPTEFTELYEKLFERGYKKIISIHISSSLSGTQQAARVARELLNKQNDIAIVDSKLVSFALAHLVIEAANMVKNKIPFYEIVDTINDLKSKIKVYFVVRNLDYLEKGGRIGKISSVLGNIFNIKPVLKLENGEILIETKSISDNGALSYMKKSIKNENNSLIIYSGWGGTKHELEFATKLKQLSEKNKKLDYRGLFEIGATIGAHTGPVYGICILKKIK